MNTGSSFDVVVGKLRDYKKKYYTNMLLKGGIFSAAILSSAYLIFNILEYYGRFNTSVRVVFFFTFISLTAFVITKWIARPLFKIFSLQKQMSDEEASVQIGKYFPEISDKLLNTLQLRHLSNQQNDLIQASIVQKTRQISLVPFTNAVNMGENKKRARLLIIPFTAILIILMFVPQLFVESTHRILNYSKEFAYPAPFEFQITNKSLTTFKNEDFELGLSLKGKQLPDNVYLVSNGKRTKMRKNGTGNFSFDFRNIQRSEDFIFEAAGYYSRSFTLEVLARPDLRAFEAFLSYPSYLNKKDESFSNAGNLTVPEGTKITWEFDAVDADKMKLHFSGDGAKEITLAPENRLFRFTKSIHRPENYDLQLLNQHSSNKEKISYYINVIPDQYPTINVEQFKDTVLFNYIALGGNIGDDYGLTSLRIFYRIVKPKEDNAEKKFHSLSIPVHRNGLNQNFFYNWNIDSLQLDPGHNIEYYLQVWDNDGVNGSKSTKTRTFDFHLPTREELKDQTSDASKSAENQIDKTLKKAQELQNVISRIENRIKTKNNLSWQDKKMMEEMLQKHEELKKEIEELKKKNEALNEKNEKFNEVSPETAYKMEQLQKLMNELLDEETKKMFEELNKLLQQQENKDQIQKLLEEMKKDQNLEQELERALEMFKELKFDQKLDEVVKDLNKLSEEQEKLSDKTMKGEEGKEKLMEEQQKLNEQFDKLKEDLKELNDINNSLENKKEMQETGQQENEIGKDMQKSSEQLKNEQNKKASGSQKDASQKMKQLAEQMQQMQQQMESQEMQENMDDLRDILENLIQLSFDQEELMKDFRQVNHSDPRYISLTQKQLKLIDDSKVIEDSLMSLAKRVFQIQSYVTREVGEMKTNMEEALTGLKERRVDVATGKQQFAMTSINNLALMLNDALKQMQQQMAESMKSQGGKMCKKPGKNQQMGLGQMQKQLNEQIQQLKQSGKTGRALSEELAKLAAQQEMIRNMLKELSKKPGKGMPGDELKKMQEQMEETEKDLVNKQLSQELINRQKELLTRLLEAEKAMREQGEEEKREAERPEDVKKDIPPSFEKYLKAKEKEIDLLKTIPPALTPYYKQEVNEYFQKIEK